tara:strand:+ start:258 stop:479 length:222 start_codon:yes stop_codon:yes gene_type:complete
MNENINSSNTQHDINKQLVSFIEKQNDLIFSLRKRLFQLERTQNRDVRILLGMLIALGVISFLMCLEFGGFTW